MNWRNKADPDREGAGSSALCQEPCLPVPPNPLGLERAADLRFALRLPQWAR